MRVSSSVPLAVQHVRDPNNARGQVERELEGVDCQSALFSLTRGVCGRRLVVPHHGICGNHGDVPHHPERHPQLTFFVAAFSKK